MHIPFFLSLLALPSVLLAAEVQQIICPDGSTCPIGQTCRPQRATGRFECIKVPQEELNQKTVIGFVSQLGANISSVAFSDVQHAYCPATLCHGWFCCKPSAGNIRKGECCLGNWCCPQKHQCCWDRYDNKWCCPQRGRCALSYMYCYGGAATLTPATACFALLALLMMTKYFL